MTKHAIYVELKAKSGKEEEVATFLKSAQAGTDYLTTRCIGAGRHFGIDVGGMFYGKTEGSLRDLGHGYLRLV